MTPSLPRTTVSRKQLVQFLCKLLQISKGEVEYLGFHIPEKENIMISYKSDQINCRWFVPSTLLKYLISLYADKMRIQVFEVLYTVSYYNDTKWTSSHQGTTRFFHLPESHKELNNLPRRNVSNSPLTTQDLSPTKLLSECNTSYHVLFWFFLGWDFLVILFSGLGFSFYCCWVGGVL